jgi:hypothetical protein
MLKDLEAATNLNGVSCYINFKTQEMEKTIELRRTRTRGEEEEEELF